MGSSRPRGDSSTKAEKKFERKLQFYAKVRDTVASLSTRKTISKKKRQRSRWTKKNPYDLSSLKEILPEVKDTLPTKFKLNCKARKRLVVKEANQLGAVLNHPAFRLDPLDAIHKHLQSTQPSTDHEVKKKKKNKNGSQKRSKNKKLISATDCLSMDI